MIEKLLLLWLFEFEFVTAMDEKKIYNPLTWTWVQ